MTLFTIGLAFLAVGFVVIGVALAFLILTLY